MAFENVSHESWSLNRRTPKKFCKSQHRPSLITAAKLVTTVPSAPHKRWNFRKINWELYRLITDKLAKDLPSPDSRNVWMKHIRIFATPSFKQQRDLSHVAADLTTDHVRMLCESLYQDFLKVPSGEESNKAASFSLEAIGGIKQGC